MEAIELDAFRQQHATDTFWCGPLLGGCGTQLSTRLYSDRGRRFAHVPDPTGLHVRQRRARDGTSEEATSLLVPADRETAREQHDIARQATVMSLICGIAIACAAGLVLAAYTRAAGG